MKIKEIELKNFHGFKHRHIAFNENFTVLIGDNGTGKTAILDGLTIALGAYFSGFKGVKSRYFRKDEILTRHFMFGKKLDIQGQYPVKVFTKGIIESEEVCWSREINDKGGTTTSKNAKSIMKYATKYQAEVRHGVSIVLPIISYYSTQRLWVQKNDKKNDRPTKLKYDRLEGYENTLDPMSDIKKIFKWIEEMRYIELQEQEPIDILSAVNNAIAECVEDCDFVRYDVKHHKLMVFKKNGEDPIPFELLSDGYRSVVGLVADLASRMAMLNPFLGDDVCKLTPGVVLIDEIDLHLHPKWQRKIVKDLKRAFPKVQFIVTTHSPFIVQSLEPGELRKLNKIDDDESVPSEEFVSKSIEDISENVMDIKGVQRSEKLNDMFKAAQRYYTLLDKGVNESDPELKKIKAELDEIEALYSSDVAYYAFLKMERKAAGMDEE
ncbi:AAA family ATPase [Bacillus thuringiensis]|uniref:AAA family ATPase n=1 Tax=Bacillus thuringiensis TaxID=1428 RepID=UPI000BECDC93|nr:AAA family ATPase [Bacillus thuringiensis]MCU5405460.1 AAA family ATPase [Bacillus cereus]MCU5510345.1 AAA family ATPase [Bacillus cereus]MDA2414736.1 AAA family ATPase [Bacillus cereus]MDR4923686.1 AAA family ATPase [Bacillus thuringiensis]MED3582803.1 AAA family ATPase [Bacillus thuringiensis]